MQEVPNLGLPTGNQPPASLATRVVQGMALALGFTVVRMLLGPVAGLRSPLPSAQGLAILALLLCVAGGIGGAAYYSTEGWRSRGGWRKTAANVAALLAYCLLLFVALLVALARTS